MISWILVLTITISGRTGAISTVYGFSTQEECQKAGQAWLNSLSSAGGWVRPATACLQQKKS